MYIYLFKQYFKIIQYFEPSFFIMENVPGIMTMKNGSIIREIEDLFTNKNNFNKGGYFLQKKVFNMEQYGIPQKRKRFILIGAKSPFSMEEVIQRFFEKDESEKFAVNGNIYSAISDLAFESITDYNKKSYIINTKTEYQKRLRNGNKVIYNHSIFNHSQKVLDRIKKIKPGENWQVLDEEIKSVHSGSYGRMVWEDKAVTITTRFDTPSAGRFIHPEFNRNITAREAARLQSFPDDFIFYGTKTSICKQIGNAVPPLFAEFLGELIKIIKNDNKRKN